jgi:hypothetical protein
MALAGMNVAVKFEKDGFVEAMPALSEKETQQCIDGMKRWEAKGRHQCEKVGQFQMHHVWLGWLRRLAENPKILSAVSQVFSTDNIFLYSSVLYPLKTGSPPDEIKESRSSTWTKDKDGAFARIGNADRRHCVTAYVALSTSDEIKGCFQVKPTRPAEKNPSDLTVDLKLNPGEFALVGPSTPTCEHVGHTNEKVFYIALRYCRTSTKDKKAKRVGKDSALLVSGEDSYYNFDHVTPAAGEGSEAGLLLREKLLKSRLGGNVAASRLFYPYI